MTDKELEDYIRSALVTGGTPRAGAGQKLANLLAQARREEREASKEEFLSFADDHYHYWRVCEACGHGWWGLHCPHDNYQNPCPECEERPIPISVGDCQCPLVMPIPDLEELRGKK